MHAHAITCLRICRYIYIYNIIYTCTCIYILGIFLQTALQDSFLQGIAFAKFARSHCFILANQNLASFLQDYIYI